MSLRSSKRLVVSRSRSSSGNSESGGMLSRVSSAILQSPIIYKGNCAACNAVYVVKRLLKSIGKAAWIVETTFIVLGLPLIIEMECDQMLGELELQQSALLGAPPSGMIS